MKQALPEMKGHDDRKRRFGTGGGLVGFLTENVFVEWTNALVYEILKVQKTLGISWMLIDGCEESRHKIIINPEIWLCFEKR